MGDGEQRTTTNQRATMSAMTRSDLVMQWREATCDGEKREMQVANNNDRQATMSVMAKSNLEMR